MSSIFSRSVYAEDMPMSTAYGILTTHVLMRGVASGGFVGSLIPLIALPARSLLKRPSAVPLLTQVLRASAVGSISTTAFMGIGLLGLMRGQGSYGWQDRSWRLRESESQVAMDYFMIGGAALGGVLATASDVAPRTTTTANVSRLARPWVRPVGLISLGAGLSMVAAMIWTAQTSRKPIGTMKKEVVEAGKGITAAGAGTKV